MCPKPLSKSKHAPTKPYGQARGVRYRMNRSIQVEGAFGVLKHDYEFRRFLRKGKTKVKLEILMLCFGYNMNKIHVKIQGGCFGHYLFEVRTA